MLARREAIYSTERLQDIRRQTAETLSATLRHGAHWEREEVPVLALDALVQLATSESEKQKMVRRWLVDSPGLDPESICAVRTPSARARSSRGGTGQERFARSSMLLTAQTASLLKQPPPTGP